MTNLIPDRTGVLAGDLPEGTVRTGRSSTGGTGRVRRSQDLLGAESPLRTSLRFQSSPCSVSLPSAPTLLFIPMSPPSPSVRFP